MSTTKIIWAFLKTFAVVFVAVNIAWLCYGAVVGFK